MNKVNEHLEVIVHLLNKANLAGVFTSQESVAHNTAVTNVYNHLVAMQKTILENQAEGEPAVEPEKEGIKKKPTPRNKKAVSKA